MNILQSGGLPIYSWTKELDSGAMEQAQNLSMLPFAHHHIAIMADAHVGFGMPIGGVLAAKNVIVPNAVGVDIGCGMIAQQLFIDTIEKQDLIAILQKIRQRVPVGFQHRKHALPEEMMPNTQKIPGGIVEREYKSARNQLGTLGGGNHFIEIQKGNDNNIWLMVHSGSRNLGKQIADHYNKCAMQENEKDMPEIVPKHWQLAYLKADSKLGQDYIAEMNYALAFALHNRKAMMQDVIAVVLEHFGQVELGMSVNIHHNYAELEHHYGEDVWLHRKGATSAKKGEWGIIPGSQGSKSFIVRGKGNKESFQSCSHGAGRELGRNQARQRLSLQKEIDILNRQGIVHGLRSKRDLDEATSAYKDILQVMENQKDLIDIIVELQPLGVIKG